VAVEEKVVLKVEVDADISNDIAAIRTRLKAIENHMGAFNKKAKDMDRGMDRVNKRFDKMRSVVTKLTGVFVKFASTLAKFSFIALAGQIGLFTAGLLAAKAALITGRAAVSAYQASLRGLSVAAAGVATAIAVAAAAMRQFNEVQLGAQFGGGPKGLNNAIRASRGIGSQTRGLLGGEATSAMVGSLGRAGVKPSQTGNIMRQLLNIAGGDAKAAQNLAAAIGSGDVQRATTALQSGVGFNQGSLKNAGSIQGILGTVGSGGATGANFQNLGSEMASTFIGTIKTEFAGLTGIFADIGAPMLEPFRKSFANISRMLKEDILSMTAVINKFGAESFAPTLETFIGATSEFIRKNIVNNLTDIKEMGQSFVNFGAAVKEFFLDIGDYLGKLEPAADVVIEMFKALGNAAGGRGLFQEFNKLVTDNASAFTAFGESIGNVIGALFDQLSGGQMGFFNKLPLLSDVFNTLANDVIPSLFGVFNKFAPLMERLPGALESLANILEMLAPIIETLVGAIDTLFGMLQGLSGGPLGAVGDLGSVALLGGLMMMTKGRGGGMLKAGVLGRGGAAAAGASKAGMFGRAGAAVSGSRGVTAARSTMDTARLRMMYSPNGAVRAVSRGPAGVGGKLGALALGLEGFSIGRDFMDGGFSGVGRGYADRAEASPIFAGLGTGTAASFLGGPVAGFAVGGATTALGAYKRGMSGDNSNMNKLTGAAGGAMAGAAIGSIIPGVGTLAGGIVGGVIGGGLAWWAGSEGQKKLKDASEKAAKKVKLNIKDFEVGSGAAATSLLAGQADLLDKAITAAVDEETGITKMEGDTREFRDYLRSIGVDPESVHRDDLFEELFNDNALADMDSQIQKANTLMTDQMQSIADETGLAMDEVERILNDFNIDPFVDYMEDNVAAIVNLANMTVGDLSQIFLPDFDASPAKRDERLETQTAQLGTILDVIEAGGTPNTSLVEDYIATNVDVNRNAGMDGATASLAAIQSFGLSLSHYAPEQAEAVMRAMGLNRDGVVMEDLLTRMFTDLGFDELDIDLEAMKEMAFKDNQVFLKDDVGAGQFMNNVVETQKLFKAFGSGDAQAIQEVGQQKEFKGVTLAEDTAAKLLDLVRSSDTFGNLEGSDVGRANEGLSQMMEDGTTVEEVGIIAEQYGIDSASLQGILTELPTDIGAIMDGVADRIVTGFINAPRPTVNISGDLNRTERGAATYIISTEVTAVGGPSPFAPGQGPGSTSMNG